MSLKHLACSKDAHVTLTVYTLNVCCSTPARSTGSHRSSDAASQPPASHTTLLVLSLYSPPGILQPPFGVLLTSLRTVTCFYFGHLPPLADPISTLRMSCLYDYVLWSIYQVVRGSAKQYSLPMTHLCSWLGPQQPVCLGWPSLLPAASSSPGCVQTHGVWQLSWQLWIFLSGS